MRRCETDVFGAPLEELQEKHGVGLQLHGFSGVGVSGAGHVWHEKLMELLEFLEWSSAKYALSLNNLRARSDRVLILYNFKLRKLRIK